MEDATVSTVEEVYRRYCKLSILDPSLVIPLLFVHEVLTQHERDVLESIKEKKKKREALFLEILPKKSKEKQCTILHYLEHLDRSCCNDLRHDVEEVYGKTLQTGLALFPPKYDDEILAKNFTLVQHLKNHVIRSCYATNRMWEVLFEKFGEKRPLFAPSDLDLRDKSNSTWTENNFFSSGAAKRKRLIITGDAGVGKTSYLLSLADNWARNTNDLSKCFTFVALLQVNLLDKGSTLIEALETILPPSVALEFYGILQDHVNQERTLFILTGFDKVSFAADSQIFQLLIGSLLPNATVLIAARPLYVPLLSASEEEIVHMVGLKDLPIENILQECDLLLNQTFPRPPILRNALYLSMVLLLKPNRLIPLAKVMKALIFKLMSLNDDVSEEATTALLLSLGEYSLFKLGSFERHLLMQEALLYMAFIEDAGGLTLDVSSQKSACGLGLLQKEKFGLLAEDLFPLHHTFYEYFASLYIAKMEWLPCSPIPLLLPQPFSYFCSEQSFDFGSKILMAGLFCCTSDNPSITGGVSLVCKFHWFGSGSIPSNISFREINKVNNIMIIGSKKESDSALSNVLLSSLQNVKHLHFHQQFFSICYTSSLWNHSEYVTVLRLSEVILQCDQSFFTILAEFSALEELFIYNCCIYDDPEEHVSSTSKKNILPMLKSFSFLKNNCKSPPVLLQINRWSGEQWPMELMESKFLTYMQQVHPIESTRNFVSMIQTGDTFENQYLSSFLSAKGVADVGIYVLTKDTVADEVVGPIKLGKLLLCQRKVLADLVSCLSPGLLNIKEQSFLSLFCFHVFKVLSEEYDMSHSGFITSDERLVKKVIKTQCNNLLSLIKTVYEECQYGTSLDKFDFKVLSETISCKILLALKSQAKLEENIIVQSLSSKISSNAVIEKGNTKTVSQLLLPLSKIHVFSSMETIQISIETEEDYETFLSFFKDENSFGKLQHLSIWFSENLLLTSSFLAQLCVLPSLSSLSIHGHPIMKNQDNMDEIIEQLKLNIDRQSKKTWSSGHYKSFKSCIFMSLI